MLNFLFRQNQVSFTRHNFNDILYSTSDSHFRNTVSTVAKGKKQQQQQQLLEWKPYLWIQRYRSWNSYFTDFINFKTSDTNQNIKPY